MAKGSGGVRRSGVSLGGRRESRRTVARTLRGLRAALRTPGISSRNADSLRNDIATIRNAARRRRR